MAKQGITRAQAEALADGFLDSIGSQDDQEFVATESLTELIMLAADIIKDAQDNLNADNNISTGGLSDSLTVGDPKDEGGVISLELFMNFYGQFINKGVKGTKSGSSKSGFSFKYANPSKKHVKAIEDWMKRAGMTIRNREVFDTKQEKKNRSVSTRGGAYMVARSIKIHGIKGNGFLDKAIVKAQSKAETQLGKALALDIENILPNTF